MCTLMAAGMVAANLGWSVGKWLSGSLTFKELVIETTTNMLRLGNVLATSGIGTIIGSIAGSCFGPIGTVIGGIIGGAYMGYIGKRNLKNVW